MRRVALLAGVLVALAAAPQALAAPPVLVSAGTTAGGHAVATWTLPPGVEAQTVEVATSASTNADGSFLSSALETGGYLQPTQTSWKDVYYLEPNVHYFLHVGGTDTTCGSCPLTEWSNVISFVSAPPSSSNPRGKQTLTVELTGSGTGSVTSNPAGIDCGTTCDQTYATNGHVTLTPKAAPGSVFTGWDGGGCFGWSPTCEVTMNVDQDVVATFDLISPPSIWPLTVARDPSTGSASAGFTVCDDSAGPLTIALIQVWKEKGQWTSTSTTTTQDHAAGCQPQTASAPLGTRTGPLWIGVRVTDVDGRQSSVTTAPAP